MIHPGSKPQNNGLEAGCQIILYPLVSEELKQVHTHALTSAIILGIHVTYCYGCVCVPN